MGLLGHEDAPEPIQCSQEAACSNLIFLRLGLGAAAGIWGRRELPDSSLVSLGSQSPPLLPPGRRGGERGAECHLPVRGRRQGRRGGALPDAGERGGCTGLGRRRTTPSSHQRHPLGPRWVPLGVTLTSCLFHHLRAEAERRGGPRCLREAHQPPALPGHLPAGRGVQGRAGPVPLCHPVQPGRWRLQLRRAHRERWVLPMGVPLRCAMAPDHPWLQRGFCQGTRTAFVLCDWHELNCALA